MAGERGDGEYRRAGGRPQGAAYVPRLEIAAIVLGLAAAAFFLPLGDPDLPMHLAVGEWIARHGRVPFEEPFAWTRAGSPYYAYSWLPQLAFYLAHAAAGAAGLHLVHALLVAAAGAAAWLLGRVEGWRPAAVLGAVALHLLTTMVISLHLRPQLALAALVPLGWTAAGVAMRARSPWPAAGGVLVVNALAANTHLFFPMLAAPALVWWARGGEPRRVALVAVATAAGWLASPYALAWPDLFRINITGNALTWYPSPIMEYRPGLHLRPVALLAIAPALLALLALPWLTGRLALAPRERAAWALLWMAGVAGFAFAARLMLVWWLTLLPLAGAVLSSRLRDEPERPPRPLFRAMLALLLVVVVAAAAASAGERRAFERAGARRLASRAASILDPMITWMDARLRPDARGRAHTGFDAGSYLTWRLRGRISASSDSRGIFPDSVVATEAYVRASARAVPLGPWRSADLAFVAASDRLSDSLAASPEWRRAALVPFGGSERAPADTITLWVRSAWWRASARVPLPPAPARLSPAFAVDPRRAPASPRP